MKPILRSIKKKNHSSSSYPIGVHQFDELHFSAPVTILTGANGSGKSTFLRILKEFSDLPDIGKGIVFTEKEKNRIFDSYTVSYSVKSKKGFYLQSEDFLSYIHWNEQERHYHENALEEIEHEYEDHSLLSYQLRRSPHVNSLHGLKDFDRELNEMSHGEGYLEYFSSRLRPNALYLLDEPETPLSFDSQLALMLMIQEAVKKGCQFIICTHSPVIMAYPNAQLYYFSETIEEVDFKHHPEVNNLKNFLNDPDRFMHHLFKGNEE